MVYGTKCHKWFTVIAVDGSKVIYRIVVYIYTIIGQYPQFPINILKNFIYIVSQWRGLVFVVFTYILTIVPEKAGSGTHPDESVLVFKNAMNDRRNVGRQINLSICIISKCFGGIYK